MFAAIIGPLLKFGPELLGDAETVFRDIAHGEGGRDKIATVLASLGHLVEHAAAAALSLPAAAPKPPGATGATGATGTIG